MIANGFVALAILQCSQTLIEECMGFRSEILPSALKLLPVDPCVGMEGRLSLGWIAAEIARGWPAEMIWEFFPVRKNSKGPTVGW